MRTSTRHKLTAPMPFGVMAEAGFTLIELIVVMGIIGMLVTIMGFSFGTWRAKYYFESDTKALYADLAKARLEAMRKKKDFFFYQPVDDQYSYAIYEDKASSTAPDGDGVLDTTYDVDSNKKPFLQNKLRNIISTATRQFGIDGNGLIFTSAGVVGTSAGLTIRLVDPKNPSATSNMETVGPDYDCVTLKATRMHIGYWNTTTCVEK